MGLIVDAELTCSSLLYFSFLGIRAGKKGVTAVGQPEWAFWWLGAGLEELNLKQSKLEESGGGGTKMGETGGFVVFGCFEGAFRQ
jgi:hypothetical protein